MKPEQVTSWCTFRNDGGRCHVRMGGVTLCGEWYTCAAVHYLDKPGKRICRECRKRLEQMEECK